MTKDEYNEFRSRLDEVESLLRWASDQYGKLRKEANFLCGDGHTWDCNDGIECLEDDCIHTNWSYSWSYDGYDSGSCTIPIEAILGTEEERLAFIKGVVKKEVDEAVKKENETIKHRKLRLERSIESSKAELEKLNTT